MSVEFLPPSTPPYAAFHRALLVEIARVFVLPSNEVARSIVRAEQNARAGVEFEINRAFEEWRNE